MYLKKNVILGYNYYLLIALMLVITTSNGQSVEGQMSQRTKDALYDIMDKSRSPNNNLVENIKGTPYFRESFSIGRILIKGKELTDNYALRYNAYADEIEVNNGLEIISLLKDTDISCLIDKEEYTYQKFIKKEGIEVTFGYLKTIYVGKKLKLYLNEIKKFKAAKAAKTSLTYSVPPKLVSFIEYYISISDEIPYEVRPRNKNILNIIIPKYKSKMKEYIKINHLNLKKLDDLLFFFKYYDLMLLSKN